MSSNESGDEWVGPRPEEAVSEPVKKKRKVLHHESLYLKSLPCAEYYEKSFMHRDVVTHVVVTRTDFIVTASCDGHIKFWKKQEAGIEFVKHFRSHMGNVQNLCCNVSGTRLASISNDKTVKIFDVENFDMINMIKLSFVPLTSEWINTTSDTELRIAISEAESSKIHIYDAHGLSEPIHTLDRLHSKPVVIIKFNSVYNVVLSIDEAGMIEYWCGPKQDYKVPTCVKFTSKLDTDLFEFVKEKAFVRGLSFSPNGNLFATIGSDRKIRVFKFLTGKLSRVFDESIERIVELQQKQQQIGNMEFGRRLAVEREFDKSGTQSSCSILFDETGHFVLYATLLGIKVVNLTTNRLVRTIGKPENLRLLSLALFQGKGCSKGPVSLELQAADNPTLQMKQADPTIVATAFRKKSLFLVYETRRYRWKTR